MIYLNVEEAWKERQCEGRRPEEAVVDERGQTKEEIIKITPIALEKIEGIAGYQRQIGWTYI